MFHCYFLFCQFLLVAWLTAEIYEYLCYIILFYIEVVVVGVACSKLRERSAMLCNDPPERAVLGSSSGVQEVHVELLQVICFA